MAYASVALLKEYASIDADKDDALLYLSIARAQAMIDAYVGYSFEASADSTRYFDAAPVGEGGHVDGRLLLFDTWCSSITSVTNGDGTAVAAASYVTQPRNATRFYGIKLLNSTGLSWERQTDDDTEKAITVVGKWAYSTSAPADIVQATLRLALWLYRGRDNSGDMDRPILAEGVMILPGQMPADVLRVLDQYKWRTA